MTEETILEYHVSALRGKVEDVPIADGVDMEEIRRSDSDAMFVSLPIAELGSVSNNGLLYDEALLSSLEEQINTKRPGGIFGHLKEEERSTSFPLPAGMWIGAKRFKETLWAKSYIPPGAARDYVRNLKNVGGEIATSIYGRGKYGATKDGVRPLLNFRLESLDFAPPARAALGMAATPHITAEMKTEQEPNMADKVELIKELGAVNVAPSKGWQAPSPSEQVSELTTVAELTNAVKAKDDVIAEMTAALEGYRLERLSAAIESQVAELTDWQVTDDAGKSKLAKLRDLLKSQILTRLGSDQKMERVAEMATAAWEDLKPIAEMLRDVLTGPAAIVNGKVISSNGRKPLEDTPENRQRAAAEMGINI